MIRLYQVDAFTTQNFSGNPAAVCPLDEWPDDEVLQNIAMENNLAETAFYVKDKDKYIIRWFTPTTEVDLCGHATLASAYVLFNYENYAEDIIHFYSPKSGSLMVSREGELIGMDFPADVIHPVEITEQLNDCFNYTPDFAFKGLYDYLLIFKEEEQIKNIIPNLECISKLASRGIIISAKGEKTDFVSRFFAPQSGIEEDPVTGSAHTTLVPYWSSLLAKKELTAAQLSPRGGYLYTINNGNRIQIKGYCKLYLIGEVFIS